MRKSSKSETFGIDPGEPPPQAQEAQRAEAELLARIEGEAVPIAAAPDVEEAVSSPSRAAHPSRPAQTALIARPLHTQRVTLDSDLFKLELEIYDLTIRENFICFSLPITTPVCEPKDTMRMVIIAGTESYPVLYVGGYFDLPQHGIKLMSFLRDVDKERAMVSVSHKHYGKKRKSSTAQNPIQSD